MMKYVIILVVGVCIGYGYGFHDAQQHEKTVVARIVDRVGGDNRETMKNDVDKKLHTLEQH